MGRGVEYLNTVIAGISNNESILRVNTHSCWTMELALVVTGLAERADELLLCAIPLVGNNAIVAVIRDEEGTVAIKAYPIGITELEVVLSFGSERANEIAFRGEHLDSVVRIVTHEELIEFVTEPQVLW